MLTNLKLKNVGPAPETELEFSPRLNLFTGDNGLGKTFLLDVAWWALTRRWPHEVNPNLVSGYTAKPREPKQAATIDFSVVGKSGKTSQYTAAYIPRDEAWVGKAGRPTNPGLVLYAHADGGFSLWDPARNYWLKKGNIDVQERIPAFVFSPKEVWEGLEVDSNGNSTIVCNGLRRDWSRWIDQQGENKALMERVLETLSPPGETLRPGPMRRLSLEDARDIPTLAMPYDPAVPVLHASSGVRRVVALAYMLVWAWSEHLRAAELLGEEPTRQIVMLFDEIESHLHPRWQRSILASLFEVAKAFNDQANLQLLAATHSPLVLASLEPLFDAEMDAWFDIDVLERNAHIKRCTFNGSDEISNWLSCVTNVYRPYDQVFSEAG